jgi:hypothetical protein
VYNVETNVKVKNVGTLDEDSKDILLRYYKRIFSGIEDLDRAGLTPRPSDAVLAGVGAALNTWPAPVPPGSYMPSSVSGPGFASASTTSGYPPPPPTVYEAPSSSGARGGLAYYGPSSQYETSSSMSYAPSPHTYGMGSALYHDPNSYDQPSMHSQAQYPPSAQMAASSHGFMYSSENTMDPSRRYSTAQYQSSNRDSYYGQGSSTAVPPNAAGYTGGFYDQQPSQYPSITANSNSYSQASDGYGPSAEQYPPTGRFDSRPPYPGPALPSAYDDDDIDLSVDPAREEALARKRRENRSDGRRRHRGR